MASEMATSRNNGIVGKCVRRDGGGQELTVIHSDSYQEIL